MEPRLCLFWSTCAVQTSILSRIRWNGFSENLLSWEKDALAIPSTTSSGNFFRRKLWSTAYAWTNEVLNRSTCSRQTSNFSPSEHKSSSTDFLGSMHVAVVLADEHIFSVHGQILRAGGQVKFCMPINSMTLQGPVSLILLMHSLKDDLFRMNLCQ